MKKVSQIKTGAVISYFSLAFNMVLGLVYTPWMVQKIGQSNYGIYTLATSLITIFMLDFGLGSAVSRFISKYRAEGNQQAANDIIGIIYKLYILIDMVILTVLVVIFFFVGNIYKSLTPDELEKFKTIYLIVVGFNAFSFPLSPLNGILNAYEKFIQLKLCDLLNRVLTVVFVVFTLFFYANVVVVVLANVISHMITIIIKFIIVKTKVPIRVNWRASGKEKYKSLFSFTVWTTINSIMSRFTHSFSPSILGMNASSFEIAIYSPAVTLEAYFYSIATAVNGLFLPRVSKYIAEKKEHEILNLMIKVGKYQVTVLGLLFVGFLCLGRDFMILWMGLEYEKTYYCAAILMLPSLISCTQQIANTTVIAKNLIKYLSYCVMVTGVLGLAISFFLSMHIGAIGVCIGTAVTALLSTVFMNVIYHKKVGINIFEFYKKCYFKAIPVYVITIILGFLVLPKITLSGWIGLFIKALLIATFYLALMAFAYFTDIERKAVIARLIKK